MAGSTVPAPLVPAHVDLRDFPFMPLEVARLRDSAIVDEVSGEEFRAAILLWCAAWHQVPAGSLPKEPRQLAKFAGYGRVVSEWEKVAEGALYGWVECSDGRLYHPVVAEKAIESWEKKTEFTQRTSSRAEQARAAAETRWEREKEKRRTTQGGDDETPNGGIEFEDAVDATAHADRMREHCERSASAVPKYKVREKENKLSEQRAARARVSEVFRELAPGRSGIDTNRVVVWMAQGYSPDLIVAVIRDGLTRKPDVGSLKYFDGQLEDAAKRPLPPPTKAPPREATPEQIRTQQRFLAIRHFRDEWSDSWPNTCRPGHPDCTTPEEIIEDARVAVELERTIPPEVLARARAIVH